MTMDKAPDMPENGQIVIVAGGVAQYRNGTFYTGMEEPLYHHAIQWPVTWWLSLPHSQNDIVSGDKYTALLAEADRMAEALDKAKKELDFSSKELDKYSNPIIDLCTDIDGDIVKCWRDTDEAKQRDHNFNMIKNIDACLAEYEQFKKGQ